MTITSSYFSSYSKLLQLFQQLLMAKRRSTDVKDNNISSKLLGTNIQDINVQKFRDLSAVNKVKYELNGKLTLPMLKIITNKFSSDVIFTVTLPDQGLSSLDALQECENLVVLNVSNNSVSSLTPLQKMRELKFLNASNNQVSSLEPLKSTPKLMNLHLEGNSIKNFDSLKPIVGCDQLRNMYLQMISGNSQNPVCSIPNYRQNVFQMLAKLRRLDGVTRGVDLNNGLQLVKKNKKDFKIQLKNNGAFYTSKFPTFLSTYPTLTGENQLKKSISDCKNAIRSLEMRLKAALAK